ncbi:unnamed protein product [marine sediment metagenome]|uniref:CopG-like ribbon-helix-helix domain-containing protein n=1 Tax=marine sediment metagenome TaxID=412755 RepID=X0SA10_9ZZZZ
MKRIAPVQITDEQREWVDNEQERIGNSIASIIRGLIQEKIDAKEGGNSKKR